MSQSAYKVLSQSESRHKAEIDNFSLSETSDELTSSQDSLDLVLVEIGSKKRKVRRKKRRRMGNGIHAFDGAESYEVSELNFFFVLMSRNQNRFRTL